MAVACFVKRLLLLLLAVVASLVSADLPERTRLQQMLINRYGPAPVPLLQEWLKTVDGAQKLSETERLKRINDFFNRRIAFDDDSAIWGQSDFWATPLDTVGKGRGDCEDFSIAKYYSLKALGIPVAKLRLVYVKARQSGPNGPVVQAHMVLAYYSSPNADPLVLDNLKPEIRPASSRSDLTPIFSFNSEGLWHGTGNRAGKSSLSRWQDLLQRARSEGFQ